MLVLAREASDRVDPTASCTGQHSQPGPRQYQWWRSVTAPPRHHGGRCSQRQRDPGRGMRAMARAREASDTVDQTASYTRPRSQPWPRQCRWWWSVTAPPRHHGGSCLQRQRDPDRGVRATVLAREASDRVDPTASSVGHLVNNGRDSVVGGAQRLHALTCTGNAACSVNVTLAEVCVPWPGLGRPLTRSIRPHLAWVT
jgi:hypothetical protein